MGQCQSLLENNDKLLFFTDSTLTEDKDREESNTHIRDCYYFYMNEITKLIEENKDLCNKINCIPACREFLDKHESFLFFTEDMSLSIDEGDSFAASFSSRNKESRSSDANCSTQEFSCKDCYFLSKETLSEVKDVCVTFSSVIPAAHAVKIRYERKMLGSKGTDDATSQKNESSSNLINPVQFLQEQQEMISTAMDNCRAQYKSMRLGAESHNLFASTKFQDLWQDINQNGTECITSVTSVSAGNKDHSSYLENSFSSYDSSPLEPTSSSYRRAIVEAEGNKSVSCAGLNLDADIGTPSWIAANDEEPFVSDYETFPKNIACIDNAPVSITLMEDVACLQLNGAMAPRQIENVIPKETRSDSENLGISAKVEEERDSVLLNAEPITMGANSPPNNVRKETDTSNAIVTEIMGTEWETSSQNNCHEPVPVDVEHKVSNDRATARVAPSYSGASSNIESSMKSSTYLGKISTSQLFTARSSSSSLELDDRYNRKKLSSDRYKGEKKNVNNSGNSAARSRGYSDKSSSLFSTSSDSTSTEIREHNEDTSLVSSRNMSANFDDEISLNSLEEEASSQKSLSSSNPFSSSFETTDWDDDQKHHHKKRSVRKRADKYSTTDDEYNANIIWSNTSSSSSVTIPPPPTGLTYSFSFSKGASPRSSSSKRGGLSNASSSISDYTGDDYDDTDGIISATSGELFVAPVRR